MKPILEVHYFINREEKEFKIIWRIGTKRGVSYVPVKQFKQMKIQEYPNFNLVFERHYQCFRSCRNYAKI